MSSKVQQTHLQRSAVVYVRQSTFLQVEKHQESARRQYNMSALALELGWRDEQIIVTDEDQGRSGETTERRSGFARVMSEVALGTVGIVLALEASRLARTNADWQRLIWFCSLTDTLLADQENIYDPSSLDDRMVLGLKGTISELEWHTIRKRMRQAALSKARRGELEIGLPAGLNWDTGKIRLTSDQAVVDALRMVFETFDEMGSARQTALKLNDQGIKLPRRVVTQSGWPIRWNAASAHAVREILTQPGYAGAYTFGRRQVLRQIEPDGTVRKREVAVEREAWHVFIRDHHEGLIDWEHFERIQEQLAANMTNWQPNTPGPAREGSALLQGLAYCGKCGRRMSVAYSGSGRRFVQFKCMRIWAERGTKFFCQVVGGRQIQEKVVNLFLDAVQPAGIEAALKAVEELKAQQERMAHHWQQRIERSEYEVTRARERYESVDARNRLVAADLERRWEETLSEAGRVREQADAASERLKRPLTELEQRRVRWMGENIGRVWNAPTTTARDRKRLLRAAIERIMLTSTERTIEIAVYWQGGEVSNLDVRRPRRGDPVFAKDEEVVALVRRLAEDGLDDTQIARVLSRQGKRTATGLTFTKRHVEWVRKSNEIPSGRKPLGASDSLYTAEEAAKELGVSSTTLHQWLREGLLRGRQAAPSAPWRIVIDEEARRRLGGGSAPEGWVGLKDAAQRLGVSKQTVATWVKSGKLQAVRVTQGRRTGWRICVDSPELGKQPSLF
jgi:excisionase family DNA binding protein